MEPEPEPEQRGDGLLGSPKQDGVWQDISEADPSSSPRRFRLSMTPAGPADALRALGGALTQELASIVAERQQVADIARQHQQRRERVVSLEHQLAEEQRRPRAAKRQSNQGMTSAERRRRARLPAPDSQVVHELEVAQEQLVESLKIIEQRYADEAALAVRAECSARRLHAAQAQLAAQTDAVEQLEQTVRRLGDEVVHLRQTTQAQGDSMQHTIISHDIEMREKEEAISQEVSRLLEESAREQQKAAEEAASELHRVTQEAESELHRAKQEAESELDRAKQQAALELQRVTQQAASEKQRLIQEAASERNRLVKEAATEKQRLITDAAVEKRRVSEDAAAEKQRLIEQAAAEKQHIRDDTASEIKRIKEQAAAEIMRIQADSASEKQQLIQRHGQLLQSARAEARREALIETTRTIESTKAEAAREARLASAAVAEATAAASQARTNAECSREVISKQSSAVAAAEASSEEYEDTLETLSTAVLGLRKTNAQLKAQQVHSDHRARSAENKMSELKRQLDSSINRQEQMKAERDLARSESEALRNGRKALMSDCATVTQRLEAVMQANHEASGRLLTTEHTLLVGSDGRRRLLEQLEGAARCLLQETEMQEAKLAKGIEAIYLAFASGDPVVDRLKRHVAAASSKNSGSNPSAEVDTLRLALNELCSSETQSSGVFAPTSLQRQLQEDCGLTHNDCTDIVDRLIKHTLEQQMLSEAEERQGRSESAFQVFLRLGWESLCDEHKRQSISNKFGILAIEDVMAAEGQHPWAKRTAVLRGDCLLLFGEKEYEMLGVAPRNKIALRTASVGQLVEIPAVSHPTGAAELAFSVSAGDATLFWIRVAADQGGTRDLHLAVLTTQRSSVSQ